MAVLLYYVMYPTRFAGVFLAGASRSSVVLLAGLVTERSARSLRIADRQAWPIRPKFGLDTEETSSPPFLYSSLYCTYTADHSTNYSFPAEKKHLLTRFEIRLNNFLIHGL